jgi:hypothetical protein
MIIIHLIDTKTSLKSYRTNDIISYLSNTKERSEVDIKREFVEDNPDAIRFVILRDSSRPNKRSSYIAHTFVLPSTVTSAFIFEDEDGNEMLAYEGSCDSAECGPFHTQGRWMPIGDAEFWFDTNSDYNPEAIKARMAALPRSGYIPFKIIEEFIQ